MDRSSVPASPVRPVADRPLMAPSTQPATAVTDTLGRRCVVGDGRTREACQGDRCHRGGRAGGRCRSLFGQPGQGRHGIEQPVPGGVGPMTVAMLLVNTVQAAEAQAYGRP